MTKSVQERLAGLEEVIMGIVEQAQKQRQLVQLKEELTQQLIGVPYYFNDYSGVIQAYPEKPTKVIAYVKNQKTGEECHWIFDSLRAWEQVQLCKSFPTWEEYDIANKLKFAQSYEQSLVKYGYSDQAVEEKMRQICFKHQIPYKDYLIH